MSITCHSHGTKQRGYVACVHVLAGAACVHFLPAAVTPTGHPTDDVGEALCAMCTATRDEEADDLEKFQLVCEGCLAKVVPLAALAQMVTGTTH